MFSPMYAHPTTFPKSQFPAEMSYPGNTVITVGDQKLSDYAIPVGIGIITASIFGFTTYKLKVGYLSVSSSVLAGFLLGFFGVKLAFPQEKSLIPRKGQSVAQASRKQ